MAPAGPVSETRIRTAERRARALGLHPVLGAAARRRSGYLAGDDEARAADLQEALDDESVAAVWALRGGYGVLRLLPLLDFDRLRRRPKAFIGFSDNTALHLALSRAGLVSFHAPHAGFGRFPPTAADTFRRVLMGTEAAGRLRPSESDPPPCTLVPGEAEGRLAGGNLSLLAAACGTPWALAAEGRIVIIEDVDEALYRVDRMLVQLRLSGALRGAAALAFGRFTRLRGEAPDRSLACVLRECAEQLGVPAVYELSFGHVADNWTLPLGVQARLHADGSLEILEAAVV